MIQGARILYIPPPFPTPKFWSCIPRANGKWLLPSELSSQFVNNVPDVSGNLESHDRSPVFPNGNDSLVSVCTSDSSRKRSFDDLEEHSLVFNEIWAKRFSKTLARLKEREAAERNAQKKSRKTSQKFKKGVLCSDEGSFKNKTAEN